MQKFLIVFTLLFTLISCAKEDQEELPVNFEGYTYLPLTVGQELIYRIDSVAYDDFTGTVDTVVYFIRELIENKVEDLSGREVFRVNVYRRNSETLAWRQLRIEERYRGTYRYEVTRNSISYVPLVFPPLRESRWNVNSLNNLEEITYRYQKLHEPFSTGIKSYDSTINVLQKDQLSLIGREYEREVYASRVGLVYKENINLQTDINSGQITSGFERRQVLLNQ